MSRRNSREAKALRRADRAAHRDQVDNRLLVQVHLGDELMLQAERGETLPCGCDARDLLHSPGWHTVDELDG